MSEESPVSMGIAKLPDEDYYFLRVTSEGCSSVVDIGDKSDLFEFHKIIAQLSEEIVKISKSEVLH